MRRLFYQQKTETPAAPTADALVSGGFASNAVLFVAKAVFYPAVVFTPAPPAQAQVVPVESWASQVRPPRSALPNPRGSSSLAEKFTSTLDQWEGETTRPVRQRPWPRGSSVLAEKFTSTIDQWHSESPRPIRQRLAPRGTGDSPDVLQSTVNQWESLDTRPPRRLPAPRGSSSLAEPFTSTVDQWHGEAQRPTKRRPNPRGSSATVEPFTPAAVTTVDSWHSQPVLPIRFVRAPRGTSVNIDPFVAPVVTTVDSWFTESARPTLRRPLLRGTSYLSEESITPPVVTVFVDTWHSQVVRPQVRPNLGALYAMMVFDPGAGTGVSSELQGKVVPWPRTKKKKKKRLYLAPDQAVIKRRIKEIAERPAPTVADLSSLARAVLPEPSADELRSFIVAASQALEEIDDSIKQVTRTIERENQLIERRKKELMALAKRRAREREEEDYLLMYVF